MSASVKDVAARAGVSLGTVSNVLNRPDIVRPATRVRVELAIHELGFVRNESARHLRAGSSRLIAYLMLDQGNPFFADLARGIDEVARENDLGVFLCDSHNDVDREQDYLALLLEERVRGVLITAVDDTARRLAELPRRGIPVVLVDRRQPGGTVEYCSVGVDDVAGGRAAARHLHDLGHRRIAFVGGPLTLPQVADRLTGARKAVGRRAVKVVQTEALDVASGLRAGARLLELADRPTAVMCANDLLALGVLQAMTRAGIAVPGEMAIVGYDDIDFAAAAAIPLTSVRQPRRELGRTAAQLLISESDPQHRHTQSTFVPELVVRASTDPG